MPLPERQYRPRSERARAPEPDAPKKMTFLQKNLWQAAACVAILAVIVIAKTLLPDGAARADAAVKSAVSYDVDVSWVPAYVNNILFPAGAAAPTASPAPTEPPAPADSPATEDPPSPEPSII